MNCPGFEKLIDCLDHQTTEAETHAVKAHLEECEQCAAVGAWYEKIRAIAAADDTLEPPSWVARRAVRLFETRRSSGIKAKLGRLVASLIFDSQAQPQVAGVRSTETMNRQLLYEADNYSIDVQISLSDEPRAGLVGQILRKDDVQFESVSRIPLDLIREGETIRSTLTSETGEFSIGEVDFGEYDLRIDLLDVSITVAGLPVAQLN
ncbi:MAG: hypothetical protein AB1631_00625 [Acidobacteriota bacterium]